MSHAKAQSSQRKKDLRRGTSSTQHYPSNLWAKSPEVGQREKPLRASRLCVKTSSHPRCVWINVATTAVGMHRAISSKECLTQRRKARKGRRSPSTDGLDTATFVKPWAPRLAINKKSTFASFRLCVKTSSHPRCARINVATLPPGCMEQSPKKCLTQRRKARKGRRTCAGGQVPLHNTVRQATISRMT